MDHMDHDHGQHPGHDGHDGHDMHDDPCAHAGHGHAMVVSTIVHKDIYFFP